jgi:2-polyprenyl-6-hydroxyphenyl methylase/3-demethylubiquinone-9 3-methyltransferase
MNKFLLQKPLKGDREEFITNSNLPQPLPPRRICNFERKRGDKNIFQEIIVARFGFGNNWKKYSAHIDEQAVEKAEVSLKEMLGVSDLKEMTFLDVGSGSGLFSLAAARLGAKNVHSFDYDPQSVNTTASLKRKYFPDSGAWTVEKGDALDVQYLSALGQFDIVYSWGVLHHTGDMWNALKNVAAKVTSGGKLFIAIYNDQGRKTVYWKGVKWIYNFLPGILKYLILLPSFVRIWLPSFLKGLVKGAPMKTWNEYKANRGMSPWYDVVDWVGGYPFEAAKPREITAFYEKLGFELEKITACGGGYGNNEFVFRKMP